MLWRRIGLVSLARNNVDVPVPFPNVPQPKIEKGEERRVLIEEGELRITIELRKIVRTEIGRHHLSGIIVSRVKDDQIWIIPQNSMLQQVEGSQLLCSHIYPR